MKTASTIYSYFLKIDTLGPIPRVTNNGNSRFASIPGAFLTIFAFIFVFVIYRQDIEDVFLENNPRIISERKQLSEAIQFNSSVSSLFFFELRYMDFESLAFKTVSKENHPKFEIRSVKFNSSKYMPNTIPDFENNQLNSYLESCTNNKNFKDFNKYSDSINLTLEEIKIKQENALCYPTHVDFPVLTSLKDNYSIVAFFDYLQIKNLLKIY